MAEQVSWVDPDGVVTPLRVKFAVKGRFAPPPRFEEEGAPEQAGMRLRAARHGVREFVLPIHVTAATEAGLRSTLRTLTWAMDPTRGNGRIRVTSPLNDQREITCRVAAGLELDEIQGVTSLGLDFLTDQLATVVFRAHDPYWYATTDTTSNYPFTGTSETFFPFFPLVLSASEGFADDVITNPGDLEAWPVWRITGPVSDVTVLNVTTGESLTVTVVSLGGAEVLTIDTRPASKTVTKQDGSNQFSKLTTTSVMWSLRRGANAIRVELGGAAAGSTVQLSYRPRYLSP